MRVLKVLFWVIIFLNSFLLFLVEPMFGRMILPVAGGSMSSWNVALMCFQILLLGGYMYSHYLPKLIGLKVYMKVHMGLLIFSAIYSFVYFKMRDFTVNTNAPSLDIILILLSTIGVPFFVLSTSSTNFQRWYSLTLKERPYHLYALSNTGNLLALVGYGLGIEVLFGLKNQILYFKVIYSAAVAMGVYVAITVYKNLNSNNFVYAKEQVEKGNEETIGLSRKLYWVLLSFIPCALMIATNSVLDNTINVNHIHYFWILPLILYLLAYIIAFSKLKLLNIEVYEKVALWFVVIIMMILFTHFDIYIYVVAMVTLFLVSLVCNLYLIKDAPNEANLTEFYMYISIGGALGGVFASLIAPLVFNNVYEYPMVAGMFLFTMLLRHKKDKIESFLIEKWEYSILFLVGLCALVLNGVSIISAYLLLIIVTVFAIRRMFMYQKSRLGTLAMFIVLTSIFNYSLLKNVDYQVRNFYGIKTIKKSDYIDEIGQKHRLVNLIVGNTLHGSQFEKGSQYEFEALTYYDRVGSTIGRFFISNNEKIRTVGVVGLGVGTLSAVSEDSQKWKYFEIDPQVVAIANNPQYLTMMEKYKHEVVLGDARITLQSEVDKYYDVLVLDAYSGDIIPASLLTKEAVELYKSKLKEDGILFFHISNRQFELKPVLSTVAKALDLECYVDTAQSRGTIAAADSEWIMMTNKKELVSNTWEKIGEYADFAIWTDDKYSIFTVLR